MHFETRFDVLLFTVRTFNRIAFEQMEAFRVREANMSHQTILMHKSFAAIWTTFWLFLMRLSVPCNFRLRMEHFTARANEVFGLWPQLQMMPIPMLN